MRLGSTRPNKPVPKQRVTAAPINRTLAAPAIGWNLDLRFSAPIGTNRKMFDVGYFPPNTPPDR